MFRNRYIVVLNFGGSSEIRRFHADERGKAVDYFNDEYDSSDSAKLIDAETGEVQAESINCVRIQLNQMVA